MWKRSGHGHTRICNGLRSIICTSLLLFDVLLVNWNTKYFDCCRTSGTSRHWEFDSWRNVDTLGYSVLHLSSYCLYCPYLIFSGVDTFVLENTQYLVGRYCLPQRGYWCWVVASGPRWCTLPVAWRPLFATFSFFSAFLLFAISHQMWRSYSTSDAMGETALRLCSIMEYHWGLVVVIHRTIFGTLKADALKKNIKLKGGNILTYF